MKRRLKQTNPEQKTRNGHNNNDLELGQDFDPVKLAKNSMNKQVASRPAPSSGTGDAPLSVRAPCRPLF